MCELDFSLKDVLPGSMQGVWVAPKSWEVTLANSHQADGGLKFHNHKKLNSSISLKELGTEFFSRASGKIPIQLMTWFVKP
jgi:hypothetical protein